MTFNPKKYEKYIDFGPLAPLCTCSTHHDTGHEYFMCTLARDEWSDLGVATQAHVCTWLASQGADIGSAQKCQIMSLAAMTA